MNSFDDVHGLARRKGRKGWKLRSTSKKTAIAVPVTLAPLLEWARLEGLLDGQRNRALEQVYGQMRNSFAHGSGYHLVSPVDSTRAIRDLAEIINRLWGTRTAEGRLHGDGVMRELLFVGWTVSADGFLASTCVMFADDVASMTDTQGWIFIAVLAARDDPSLNDFDSSFEVTNYPVGLLWGPGNHQEAVSASVTLGRPTDRCGVIDRVFAVQVADDVVYLPRRGGRLNSLPVEQRGGRWHLIRADHPLHAFVHVRDRHSPELPTASRADARQCDQCATTTVVVGEWADVHAEALRLEPRPTTVSAGRDVAVPRRFPYPDNVGYR